MIGLCQHVKSAKRKTKKMLALHRELVGGVAASFSHRGQTMAHCANSVNYVRKYNQKVNYNIVAKRKRKVF